jgi:hypothetical protein
MEQSARPGLKEVDGSGPGSAAAHSCRHASRLWWDARAGGLPLWMLVLHDDADHEFDYATRAESCSTQRKPNAGPFSIRDDWAIVFGD